MEEKLIIELLKRGGDELSVPLTDATIALFLRYFRELKAWNRKINLTSIENDREIILRHFLDSLIPYPYIKGSKRLLDIGSGAGFPGIPIKIHDPSISVTLVDSVEKKVHFMKHIIRTLGLTGIEAVWGRVEDRSMIDRYSGAFDCVISRAFSELKDYLRLSLPYLAPGGTIIAIKGPAYEKELKEVEGLSGLERPGVFEAKLPFTDRTTVILTFRKAVQ
jgi:16S rRNA (guanine527-N7)-methyltransferase